MKRIAHTLICLTAICLAASAQQYDVIIRNGTVYDGSGGTPIIADVALQGDRIARIGRLGVAQAKTEINAKGLAVAPGFINMMTGEETLMADGRSQSDIRQGVTLEIFGSLVPSDANAPSSAIRKRRKRKHRKQEIEGELVAPVHEIVLIDTAPHAPSQFSQCQASQIPADANTYSHVSTDLPPLQTHSL